MGPQVKIFFQGGTKNGKKENKEEKITTTLI